jgi:hypothetical protein
MNGGHDLTLRQLEQVAARHAKFYFGSEYRTRMLSERAWSADGTYSVLASNQFVPLKTMPASATVLRRFVRGTRLDPSEREVLDAYWDMLGRSVKQLSEGLKAGEPTVCLKEAAQALQTWPAVGVVTSEEEMRGLLMVQFERMRQKRIAWRGVDSSTYPAAARDCTYVLVEWFWHGI